MTILILIQPPITISFNYITGNNLVLITKRIIISIDSDAT